MIQAPIEKQAIAAIADEYGMGRVVSVAPAPIGWSGRMNHQVNLLVESGVLPTVLSNITDAESRRAGTHQEASGILALSRAMPNPTSGSTSLHMDLPSRAWVRATVHDVAGRLVDRVADGPLEAGSNTLAGNGMRGEGGQAAAGVYFFRIQVDDRTLTRTVIVVH